jgi:hypothetical protein
MDSGASKETKKVVKRDNTTPAREKQLQQNKNKKACGA